MSSERGHVGHSFSTRMSIWVVLIVAVFNSDPNYLLSILSKQQGMDYQLIYTETSGDSCRQYEMAC